MSLCFPLRIKFVQCYIFTLFPSVENTGKGIIQCRPDRLIIFKRTHVKINFEKINHEKRKMRKIYAYHPLRKKKPCHFAIAALIMLLCFIMTKYILTKVSMTHPFHEFVILLAGACEIKSLNFVIARPLNALKSPSSLMFG